MGTTAEVTGNTDHLAQFPQPTLTPANSIIDKDANQILAQATSNAVSYSVIKPLTQKPTN